MTPSDIVELRLSDDQADQLAELARTAAGQHRNVLFVATCAPSREGGECRWKLQVVSLPQAKGAKVLKLIRENGAG